MPFFIAAIRLLLIRFMFEDVGQYLVKDCAEEESCALRGGGGAGTPHVQLL